MSVLTGLLILLLSIAGHTEWWVIAVNRSHSFPIRPKFLRKFRSLHDVAVPMYPAVLLALTSLGPDALLRGASWSVQPVWLRWLLVATGTGSVPLMFAILRWQLAGRRAFRNCVSSQRHDVEQIAGPSARGLNKRLTRIWSRNEFCSLETNIKSVTIPVASESAQRTQETLRILHFSDLHFTGCPGEPFYQFVVDQALKQPVDLIAFTGDLIDDPDLLPMAQRVLQRLAQHAPCVFILGNHDWRFDLEQIRMAVESCGWFCVTRRPAMLHIRGRSILIAGSEQPWVSEEPPAVHDSGRELRILLSHSPDQYRVARRLGYHLMLSGHTHGGQVVLPIMGPVYSPSLFGVRFASGLFRLGSLVLHVSRGVGAKDPLRWNCPPELTVLEVRGE